MVGLWGSDGAIDNDGGRECGSWLFDVPQAHDATEKRGQHWSPVLWSRWMRTLRYGDRGNVTTAVHCPTCIAPTFPRGTSGHRVDKSARRRGRKSVRTAA